MDSPSPPLRFDGRLQKVQLDLLQRPIVCLGLTTRSFRSIGSGLRVADLLGTVEQDLMHRRNFGRACLTDVRRRLALFVLDALLVPEHDARRTLMAGDDPALAMAWNSPPQPRRLGEVLEELLELLSRQAQAAERKATAGRRGRREGAKAPRATLADVADLVFGCLTPREREVMEVRFTPAGDELPGYAEIGRRLGLSRERVRQVVAAALARMESDLERQRRRWLTEELAAAFEAASGVLSEAQLQELLRKRHPGAGGIAVPLVRVLLETTTGYERVRGTVWCAGLAPESAAASLDRLHDLLRRSGRVMAPTQLAVLFRQEPPFGAASDAFIAACLAADPRLRLLDARRVGLREWRWGVPKTVEEALTACLRDAEQPLPVAQLVARVGSVLPRETSLPPSTVQRALDEGGFIQVEPGVYALCSGEKKQ